MGAAALDHKHTRVEMSEQSLTRFQLNQQDFLRQFVTTDETWVHYYTPKTKQRSKQWKHAESPPPKKQRQYGRPKSSWLQFSRM